MWRWSMGRRRSREQGGGEWDDEDGIKKRCCYKSCLPGNQPYIQEVPNPISIHFLIDFSLSYSILIRIHLAPTPHSSPRPLSPRLQISTNGVQST